MNISEQMNILQGWLSLKSLWAKKHDLSGSATPGSCGENEIIGFLPPSEASDEKEITIIYKCRLPMTEELMVEKYQLSSLSFSDWRNHMTTIKKQS